MAFILHSTFHIQIFIFFLMNYRKYLNNNKTNVDALKNKCFSLEGSVKTMHSEG